MGIENPTNLFVSVNPERDRTVKKNKPKAGKPSEEEMSRRDFLKFAKNVMVGVTGIAVTAAVAENLDSGKKIGDYMEKFFNRDEPSEEKDAETEEQKEIHEEDIEAVREVVEHAFDPHKEKIELPRDMGDKIKAYWLDKYENGYLKKSMVDAYREMGSWADHLEKIFSDEGVDPKYMYLAIPESHWKLNAVSRVGAAGPYQFMPQTALGYGLKIDRHRGIDERKDPIKSAEACARYLKHLETITGDMDLALTCYNGGFMTDFLSQKKAAGDKPPYHYEDFLSYMEDKANNLKSELSQGYYTRKVRHQYTAGNLAARLKVSVAAFCKENSFGAHHIIVPGSEVKVPVPQAHISQKLFSKSMRGFSENLNYPHKFNAIYELIEKGVAGPRRQGIRFREETVANVAHTVKRGENLHRLSKTFGVSPNLIKMANKNVRHLIVGTQLKIPATLESLARKHNTNVGHLLALNPAYSRNSILRDGETIRI